MMTEFPNEQRISAGYADVDSFDVLAAVTRIISAIVKHWVLILITIILCLGLVYTYMKQFPPVYRAEVMVQAEAEDDLAREQFYANWNTFRKSELSTEVQLMTSTPVVREVVETLNLTYDDVYHTPLRQLVYIWEKSTIGNWYRSAKNWISPPVVSPFSPSEEESALGRTISAFKDGAQLEPIPDSTIGYLVVKGPTYRVAEYANLLADAYARYRQETYAEEAETAFQALNEEVARAMEEQRGIMQTRLEFEVENGLALGLAKDKALMENWATLETTMQSLEFRLNNLEAGYEIVSELLENESPTLTSSSIKSRNAIHDGIRSSVFALQKDLNVIRRIYQPDAPEIRDMESQLAILEAQLPDEPAMVDSAFDQGRSVQFEQLRGRKMELEVEMASVRAELLTMKEAQQVNELRVIDIPALEAEYQRLLVVTEMSYSKLGLLREKLMQADVSRITAKSAPPALRTIEYASIPDKPDWPNSKLLYLIALMLGTFGGVGLAILIEMLNNKATRDSLLARNDLPVYAAIQVSHRSAGLLRVMRKPDSRATRPSIALDRLKSASSASEASDDSVIDIQD